MPESTQPGCKALSSIQLLSTVTTRVPLSFFLDWRRPIPLTRLQVSHPTSLLMGSGQVLPAGGAHRSLEKGCNHLHVYQSAPKACCKPLTPSPGRRRQATSGPPPQLPALFLPSSGPGILLRKVLLPYFPSPHKPKYKIHESRSYLCFVHH